MLLDVVGLEGARECGVQVSLFELLPKGALGRD